MTARTWRRTGAMLLVVGVMLVTVAVPALAHPLGNFTTNTYLGVSVAEDRITIDHVLDLAEIPTLQTLQQLDLDADVTEGDLHAYRDATCASTAASVELTVDGARIAIVPDGDGTLSLPPGEAGLDTLRLECPLVAQHQLTPGASELIVTQPPPDGRIGWREITLLGDGVTVVTSDVPEQSLSSRLVAYPEERLASPLDVSTATASVRPGGPSAVGLPLPDVVPDGVARGVDRISGWFTSLVAVDRLTVPFVLLATLVATALGTLHALAPGHGKTVMAAYLVGRQGTTRDAFLLGGTVAITHTLGVFLLGVLLSATQTASPERIYPWLGAGSGLLFALVGVTLLRQALRGGHEHHHGPGGHTHGPAGHTHGPAGHTHGPGGHTHGGHAHGPADHAHDGHTHEPADPLHAERRPSTRAPRVDVAEATLRTPPHQAATTTTAPEPAHRHEHPEGDVPRRSTGWKGLLAPGLAGGLVPSPSALLVLLGGFAIGRAWFGVGLVIAYGVGMAATLVGAGYLLLRARHRLQRAMETSGRFTRAATLFRWLPVATSALIIIGGLVIVVRSIVVL